MTNYFIFQINLAGSKPTFSSNPLISSIFSSQKDDPESHIAKIPSKSTKENLEATTIEPTDPPPSFVERKIGKAVEKILTLSQLVNSLRATPENLENEDNDNGFIPEDQTNQPPSFVEQKIGKIVDKLFRISQFASNVRERFNMPPNHIFEYVHDSKEEVEEKKEDRNIDFDKIFAEEKSSEDTEKKYIPLIRTGTEKEIESLKSSKEISANKTTLPKVNIYNQTKLKEINETRNEKELDFENMEAFKVYLFNKNILNQKIINPKKDIERNSTNLFINKTVAENEIIMGDLETIKPSNSSITVNFSGDDDDNKNEGSTLKQTAEKVGYFVLELFASVVGLTLGAVSQINHVFHKSNNTILEGIYNSTH